CFVGSAGCPLILAGMFFPCAVLHLGPTIPSGPDDHFIAGPHCRVSGSTSRRVGSAGSCPTVRAGIVSPAGVQPGAAVKSAPDDHFGASPDRCPNSSDSRRVGGASGCPTIRAGIVSRARVQIRAVISAPDNHFAAGPDCRVAKSDSRRVGGAGRYPAIGAIDRWTSYGGEGVFSGNRRPHGPRHVRFRFGAPRIEGFFHPRNRSQSQAILSFAYNCCRVVMPLILL